MESAQDRKNEEVIRGVTYIKWVAPFLLHCTLVRAMQAHEEKRRKNGGGAERKASITKTNIRNYIGTYIREKYKDKYCVFTERLS